MKISISNKITVTGASSDFLFELKNAFTIENPEFVENERMNRWNGQTPGFLQYYQETDGGLEIPRGFARQLIGMAKRSGESYQVEDRRRILPSVEFNFQGQLRPFQEEAIKAMLSRDFGTLDAPTGSGKTIMALYMIAERKQPVLVATHNKELQRQWVQLSGQFLGIPEEEVGIIGDGQKRIGKRITVALVQTLNKCCIEVSPYIGFLICDEAHRTPSRTFTKAVSAFDSRYMTGLSATPWERDGLSQLIGWYLGDITHSIQKELLIQTGDVLPAEVIIRETDFKPHSDPVTEYSTMLGELTEDTKRNNQIVQDVIRETSNGAGVCLVLSDRKAHCENIHDLLAKQNVGSEVLTGEKRDEDRIRIVEELKAGHVRILIATIGLVGEGFDAKELSTLFLMTPIKFDGRLIQSLGRVLRPGPGKKQARVYDYVDINVGVLRAASKSRARVYGKNAFCKN